MTRDIEWYRNRQKTLGASEWAAALGMSRWQTPAELQKKKLGEVTQQDLTEAQAMGHVLQDIIATTAARNLGLELAETEVQKISESEPWASATIDWSTKCGKIIECKATSDYSWDYIPDYYQIQLAVQCFVHNVDHAVIAVLHASTKLKTYDFHFSQCQWWPEVLEKARNWWNEHIVLGVPIEGLPVKHEIPPVPGKIAELTVEDHERLIRYSQLQKVIKEHETELDGIKKQLQERMGDAEIAVADNRILMTFKATESERFDSTAFKKEHPDLAAQYVKTSVSRRFLVKEKELAFN